MSNISFVDTHNYYKQDPPLYHQVEAIKMLQALVQEKYPELIKEDQPWVRMFRNLTPTRALWTPEPDMVSSEPKITIDQYRKLANLHKVSLAALLAFVEVESVGSGYNTDGSLKMLFEGQWFWWNLRQVGINPAEIQARMPTVCYPTWNSSFYLGGVREYNRLRLAMTVHRVAAIRSASYGLGQILGVNAESLGYKDTDEMLNLFEHSEFNQVEGICRFLNTRGIMTFIRAGNWNEVARRYNGEGYARHGYHTKLLNAYNKYLRLYPNG